MSVILYGLAEVIGVRCCSMILPSMTQIREGKEFSQLTNGVSGVSVVLRVGLLCRVKELREADVDHQGLTLSSLLDGLREDGMCYFHRLFHYVMPLTCFTVRSAGGGVCRILGSARG